jgi:hypothetical protein
MVTTDDAEQFGAQAAVDKILYGRNVPYTFHYPDLQAAEDIGFAEAAEFIEKEILDL